MLKQGLPASSSSLLFLPFLFFSYAIAFIPPHILLNHLSQGKSLTNQELWFNQTLDHFSPYVLYFFSSLSYWNNEFFFFWLHIDGSYFVGALQDHRQFRQRYYEFLDYFRIPDGPIFLVIGGEGTCRGISNNYIAVSCNSSHRFIL